MRKPGYFLLALFVVAAGVFLGWRAGESLDRAGMANVEVETELLIERVRSPQPTLAPISAAPSSCCRCCDGCTCSTCGCCELPPLVELPETPPPPVIDPIPIELAHPTPVAVKPPIQASPKAVKAITINRTWRRRPMCRRRFFFRRRFR